MKKISVFVVFLLTFLIYFGCSQKDEWKGSIQYLNGVKIVKNPGEGIWEKDKKEKKVIFKEEFCVGSKDQDKNYVFHQPKDMVVDRNGAIYILDSDNYRIQKFDKTGNYLLTIGQKGQGPGDIMSALDIELDSKGNLFVFDMGNSRISKFDPQGRFLNSIKTKINPFCGALDSEDNIYVFYEHDGKLIHKFNSQGKHMFSFMAKIKNENKIVEFHQNNVGRIVTADEDKVILALAYPYAIYIHNTKGELLQKILNPTSYARPVHITSSTDPLPDSQITRFIIIGLDVSPRRYIFCRNISFDIPPKADFQFVQDLLVSMYKKYSYVDIFDPEGRFLIHQKAAGFCWGGHFDEDGCYYGLEEGKDCFIGVKYSIQLK